MFNLSRFLKECFKVDCSTKYNICKIKLFFIINFVFLSLSCDLAENWLVTSSPRALYEDGITIDSFNRMIITQYGISWIFDKPYQTGQFINGDYYIIGPAKLESIYPKPKDGRNGSMINPAVGSMQAYDSRAENYDESLGVTLTCTLSPGESLVSTISSNSKILYDFNGNKVTIGHAKLETAAILTCLATSPAVNTFRPPYMGTTKTQYTFSGLTADMLPELSFTLPTVTNYDSVYDYYIRGFKRPWLIHQTDWTCELIHPVKNMKNYHAEVGKFIGEASLLLLLDPGVLSSKRAELLIFYLQYAIDLYHMCIQGSGDSSFNAWPVIFLGLMLNNAQIYSTFVNHDNKYDTREHRMTYYIPDDITSSRSSLILTSGELWTGYISPNNTRPAWRQDPQDDEHEHLHPTEWAGCGDNPGGIKREAYRTLNSPEYVSQALAALILDNHITSINVKSLYNHDAFFDYVDRWMNEDMTTHCQTISTTWSGYTYGKPLPSEYQTSDSDFVDNMWATYRGLY